MLLVTCHLAQAQLQLINLSSPATNIQVSSALITVPGWITNAPYTASNPAVITFGDPWNTVGGKINSNFAYCSNEFNVLAQLPNQINTNWQTYATTVSNRVAALAGIAVTNGGRMMFDWDGARTNIVSDGHGNLTNRGSLTVGNGALVNIGGSHSVPNTRPAFKVQYTNTSYSLMSVWSPNGFFGDGGCSETVELDVPDVNHFFQATSCGNMIIASSDPLYLEGGTASYPRGRAYLGDGMGYGNSTYVEADDSAQQVTIAAVSGLSADAGAFKSDGNGNVTCLSLTQTSDVDTKTNIVALDPAGVLPKLLAIPVYRWNFRDYASTNVASYAGTNSAGSSVAGTNIIQHHVSGVAHFGPMAQDWAVRFGGHTNGISVIDLQGLLLAGVQALAQNEGVFTNAAGARFRLMVNAATNGFVFAPQ